MIHRVMCLVVDEVGNNIGQIGDSAIGGEKCLCTKGTNRKEIANTKDKHWTLNGLTALSRELVMRAIIFSGGRSTALLETRMGIFDGINGVESDVNFFKNDFRPGKLYLLEFTALCSTPEIRS